MRPGAGRQLFRQRVRLILRQPPVEQLLRRALHLRYRLAADIGADQRLVVDLGERLLFDYLDQRGRRKVAQLRIDRPEYRIGRHHDLVGGESDERTAGHGVMRHEYRGLSLVGADRAGDLQRGKHESARRMQPSE